MSSHRPGMPPWPAHLLAEPLQHVHLLGAGQEARVYQQNGLGDSENLGLDLRHRAADQEHQPIPIVAARHCVGQEQPVPFHLLLLRNVAKGGGGTRLPCPPAQGEAVAQFVSAEVTPRFDRHRHEGPCSCQRPLQLFFELPGLGLLGVISPNGGPMWVSLRVIGTLGDEETSWSFTGLR